MSDDPTKLALHSAFECGYEDGYKAGAESVREQTAKYLERLWQDKNRVAYSEYEIGVAQGLELASRMVRAMPVEE